MNISDSIKWHVCNNTQLTLYETEKNFTCMHITMKSMTKTIIIARVDLCSSSFCNRMCENIREKWNVES